MKTTIPILSSMLLCISFAFPNTIIVDINGGGQFTSIQTAILNSSAGDTIKVWPGTYNEQITVNKNITLMGSGYENTIIISNLSPCLTITSGKILWFLISSLADEGIRLNGGVISNCVIQGCSGNGIATNISGGQVINCIITNNGGYGIRADISNGTRISVINCISWSNGDKGFNGQHYVTAMSSLSCIDLSYSNGSTFYTAGNQGCINLDPSFKDRMISESLKVLLVGILEIRHYTILMDHKVTWAILEDQIVQSIQRFMK